MIYYVFFEGEDQESGTEIPIQSPEIPEGSSESGASGTPATEEESTTEYPEGETEAEEEEQKDTEEIQIDTEETQSNQYGLVEVDYSEHLEQIYQDVREILTVCYSLAFVLFSAVIFSLILRILRK